jgi:drug/metabolite transporter (DMT)-like permease
MSVTRPAARLLRRSSAPPRPAVGALQPAPAAPPAPRHAPGWQVWSALWTVYIVWGSTYLAIRVVVDTMPPFLTGGVRFMLAGAIVYAVLLVRRGPGAVGVRREELLPSALIGGLLVTGGNGLVMAGETDVPSGLAALIIASVPLWIVVYRRVSGERIAGLTLAGVALGFGGVALLFLPGGGGGGGDALGYVLVLCAAPCWALGSFLSGRMTLPRDPFLSTSVQMLLGGALSIAVGLATGEVGEVDPASFSSDSLLAFAYLVVVGSLIAFTAYVWVLQHAPVSKVSTYAYVNPVIAVFLGWLILSEEITPAIVAGAAVIVCSVAAIVRRESH